LNEIIEKPTEDAPVEDKRPPAEDKNWVEPRSTDDGEDYPEELETEAIMELLKSDKDLKDAVNAELISTIVQSINEAIEALAGVVEHTKNQVRTKNDFTFVNLT
jgi:hypothetical protein